PRLRRTPPKSRVLPARAGRPRGSLPGPRREESPFNHSIAETKTSVLYVARLLHATCRAPVSCPPPEAQVGRELQRDCPVELERRAPLREAMSRRRVARGSGNGRRRCGEPVRGVGRAGAHFA